ncbi:hypothetical protein ACWDYH_31290 [Nocardia goodfellowii]
MKKPTRAQTRVLQALHARATELAQLTREADRHRATTGDAPGREWFERYHQHATLHEALTSAAEAAAIPREWIAQVREDGEHGTAWSEVQLPEPGAKDWDRVLGDLTTQARQLCEWTALGSARRQYGPVSAEAGEAFGRNLAALRARLTGVVNLLDLDASDGKQLWGTTSDWVESGYQLLADRPAESVLQSWETVVRADTEPLVLQAKALAKARITTHTTVALPDHDSLTARLGVLALGQPKLFHHPGAGTDISAAVEAAEPDTTIAEPVFSAPDIQSTPAYEADIPAVLPEFRAPANEPEL